jgi:hypothetical protein
MCVTFEVRTTHFFLAKHDVYSYSRKVLWLSFVVPDLIQHVVTDTFKNCSAKELNNRSVCRLAQHVLTIQDANKLSCAVSSKRALLHQYCTKSLSTTHLSAYCSLLCEVKSEPLKNSGLHTRKYVSASVVRMCA